MKYSIILIFLTAGLIIAGFISPKDNWTKDDKLFYYFLVAVFIISTIYFSIKDGRGKEIFENKITSNLDTTVTNTKVLIKDLYSLNTELSKGIDSAKDILNNINSLNTNLFEVNQKADSQLQLLEESLSKAETFQINLEKQLEIEITRFDQEKPNLDIPTNAVFIKSTKDYSYDFEINIVNNGGRVAIIENLDYLMIPLDKELDTIGTTKMKNSKLSNELTSNSDSIFTVIERDFCNQEEYERIEIVFFLARIIYKDMATSTQYTKKFAYQWDKNQNPKKPTFYFLRPKYKSELIRILNNSNLQYFMD
ncbi:hypothetical protein [Aquimarina rubra]|uniref:Gliding motility-associated protein GldM N-terminal domain-containing protein n=1 Tax=Aquimarina rubra TaxID=1920033 RepID=A0ABW5LHW2_9FLAO